MTAIDLIAWTKLLGFHQQPELARCEVAAFRCRVLHVAARISHNGRRTRPIEAAGCVGLQLRDVLLVTADRWRSLRCTGPACCPRGADPCRRQPRRGTHPARCPASR